MEEGGIGMLEIKGVEKQFLNEKGIHELSVNLYPGEITVLLGRNGSGKTTLFKCILGLLEMTKGQILLDGIPTYRCLQDVAFASADGSSLPYMKVSEYGHFLSQYYSSFVFADYQNFVERFALDMRASIRSLSKGEKMKVELAAAFAQHAKLILLDEPFTSLDVYAKEDCIKALLEEVLEERIVLVSTHDIAEIEEIADRCILLEKGKLVKSFTMDELHEEGKDLKECMTQYQLKP